MRRCTPQRLAVGGGRASSVWGDREGVQRRAAGNAADPQRLASDAVADDPNARDRFPYPGGNVIGVLMDGAALDDARERLQQAGFGPDRYEVLEGERDAGRIDLKGEEHGRAGGFMRKLQSVFSDDADHAR